MFSAGVLFYVAVLMSAFLYTACYAGENYNENLLNIRQKYRLNTDAGFEMRQHHADVMAHALCSRNAKGHVSGSKRWSFA